MIEYNRVDALLDFFIFSYHKKHRVTVTGETPYGALQRYSLLFFTLCKGVFNGTVSIIDLKNFSIHSFQYFFTVVIKANYTFLKCGFKEA